MPSCPQVLGEQKWGPKGAQNWWHQPGIGANRSWARPSPARQARRKRFIYWRWFFIYLLEVIFSLAVPRTGVAPQLRKRGQEQAPGEGGRTRNPPGRDGSTGRRLRLPRTPHGDGTGGVLVEAAASGGHGGSLGTRCWWHTHRVRSHSLTLAHTQLLLRVPGATSPRRPPALATQPLGQPAGSSRTGGQGQPQAAPPKPLPPRCCLISAPSASAQPGTG